MSCPQCPHCIASGARGLIDPSDPALSAAPAKPERRPLNHYTANGTFSKCGVYAFRYKDRRTGAGVSDWKDVNCRGCLIFAPPGALR